MLIVTTGACHSRTGKKRKDKGVAEVKDVRARPREILSAYWELKQLGVPAGGSL